MGKEKRRGLFMQF